jgi:aspartyl-tRNA synthetase
MPSENAIAPFPVAICYRHEKLTTFRQSEFPQLDLDLSFTSQAVTALVELIVHRSWPEEELVWHLPWHSHIRPQFRSIWSG